MKVILLNQGYILKSFLHYQILTSMLYFCNCTAMSPKLSALGKVLLVPSKAPPCDTQPSTCSHVIISRSPLTRPSKPDLIPKGLFPSLMHVRTNDLTGRKKKSFWLSILKTYHHFRGKKIWRLSHVQVYFILLFNAVCNWLLFLSVFPTYLKDQTQVLDVPDARHYKPRLVFFLPNFHFDCGLYCRQFMYYSIVRNKRRPYAY